MKQKYALIRDNDNKTLVIREYAELDKEMMSLLCEESYSQQELAEALTKGTEALLAVIRTNNLYPPSIYALPIADAIKEMFQDEEKLSAELVFDDKDLFIKEAEILEEETEEVAEEAVDVDELLEEDELSDDFDEKTVINNIKTSIKVADDEPGDLDEVP